MAVTLIHLGVAGLLAGGAFGAWVAAESGSALVALAWLAGGGALYIAVLAAAREESHWRRIACVLIGTGALASLYVALVYRQLGYPEKVTVATALGQLTSAIVPAINGWTWTPFPNSLATWLEGLLPLAAGVMWGRRTPPVERTMARVGCGLIALGLLLSASRGAWVGEGVAFGLWGLSAYAKRQPRWLAVGSAALAATLVLATAWTLFADPEVIAAQVAGSPALAPVVRTDRLDLYRHSLSLVRDFPVTGIGLGDQFAMALSQQALLIQVPFLTYPHNLLLNQWLEQGLPGALVWVLLVASVIVCGFAGERAGLGRGYRGAYLGVVATIVHGLSDARQAVDGWTWWPLFVLLALMAVPLRRARLPIDRRTTLLVGLAPATLAAVTMVTLWPIEAAWDANVGGWWELHGRTANLSAVGRDEAIAAAEAAYRRALEIDDRQPTARRRLGILAMATGQYPQAVMHLQIAAAEAPDNWTTRKALGLACTWMDDVPCAVRYLGSLHDPNLPGELEAWAHWRDTRGEQALSRRAAEMSARLQGREPRPAAGTIETLPSGRKS